MRKEVIDFYEVLGVKGLSNILDEESNKAYITFALSKAKGRILDAGCGYGRVAIPIYKAGYNIVGVDIMPEFIDAANSKISDDIFSIGDIQALSFEDNSFDTIICLWSTFNHFLTQKNQLEVLQEFYRVLKKRGQVIIDLPTPEIYQTPSFLKIKMESPHKHISVYTVNGVPNSDFVHDEETLNELMQKTDFKHFSIYRTKLAKLPRLMLEFSK